MDEQRLVNNSDIGFFYKNEQLDEYRKQKKPDKTKVIKISNNIVTTDFTKQEISIVPDTKKTYTGSTNLIVSGGKLLEYVSETETGFLLGSGSTVAKEDSFKVELNTGIWGANPVLPHKIEPINKYYSAFTEELQSIYFEFTSSNEFASVHIAELSDKIQYSLFDSEMKELKNGFSASDSLEVQWKGKGAATYILKLTGSFTGELEPFCVFLPSDNNEWMWQMSYTDIGSVATGVFDYYGDEDFFVIPPQIIENSNKAIISFTKLPADTNIVVYDKDKNVLAQYLQKKDSAAPVSLYALENAYAISLYSFDGAASGEKYEFSFGFIDTLVLDIQTFGFSLSPGYSDEEDYYTATINSLEGKKITDIMTTVPTESLSIKVVQQCGYEYIAKEDEELKLGNGRNTVTISFNMGELQREIVIVISCRISDVYYAFTSSGKRVFVVEDIPENNNVKVQEESGKIVSYKRSELFSYAETQMPDSYKEKIEALQDTHPDWKFTFVKTGYDFNSFVNTQLSSSKLGGATATKEQIAYYVDPRNFLNETDVFMFENQFYNKNIEYGADGIKSIWVEKESAQLSKQMIANLVTEAGSTTGLSPYFITARALLESGHGSSALARGAVKGYEGYYNFFGIGAYDLDPANGGAAMAKAENWNTKRKALIEGSAWINRNYIGNMQPTIYFMKFCFVPNRTWHQYMTDIEAPKKDAQSYYKAHKNGGTLNGKIEFIIPVFDNMP